MVKPLIIKHTFFTSTILILTLIFMNKPLTHGGSVSSLWRTTLGYPVTFRPRSALRCQRDGKMPNNTPGFRTLSQRKLIPYFHTSTTFKVFQLHISRAPVILAPNFRVSTTFRPSRLCHPDAGWWHSNCESYCLIVFLNSSSNMARSWRDIPRSVALWIRCSMNMRCPRCYQPNTIKTGVI